MRDRKFYLNIIITIVLSYILIKFIDNYKYFFEVFNVLLSLLTPFVIAFILAYAFNPIVTFMENKLKLKRLFALLITYGFLIILLITFIVFTVPAIIGSLADIVSQLPLYAQKTQDFVINLGESLKTVDPATLQDIGEKFMGLMPQVSNLLIGYLGNIFSTTFSVGKFIVQFGLAFIICFYILLEKESFILFSKKIIYICFGKRAGEFTLNVCNTLNLNIGKYFSGKILDSFIII